MRLIRPYSRAVLRALSSRIFLLDVIREVL